MSDVIRVIQSQKESIEKLIPALLKEYEEMVPTGISSLDFLREHHIASIKDRDYSTILSILICKAAHDMGVDLLQ